MILGGQGDIHFASMHQCTDAVILKFWSSLLWYPWSSLGYSVGVQVCISQCSASQIFPDLPRSSQLRLISLTRNAFLFACSGHRPRWGPLRLRNDAERSHRIQEVQQQKERPGASDLNKGCQNMPFRRSTK